MKRCWPLAFLLLLFGALAVRPIAKTLRPTPSLPRPAVEQVVTAEPPSPVAPTPPAPPADEARPKEEITRSAVGSGILWIAKNQNPDGSWGSEPVTVGGRTIGRTGITAMALLSLLGAGYSQLSKDEYDGLHFGQVVKKALLWLIQDQREDGSFRSIHDAGFDQALASQALGEAYGMTASQHLKEPAEQAAGALFRMQDRIGSWGGPEQTAWGIQALYSLEESQLMIPWEVRQGALEFVDRTPHAANPLSRILLTKQRSTQLTREAEALAAGFPQIVGGDFSELYHATFGLFQYDGPDGPVWKRWNDLMKNALIPTQGKDGSWQGGTPSHTIVRTSLGNLTLQVYYRYANVFSTGK